MFENKMSICIDIKEDHNLCLSFSKTMFYWRKRTYWSNKRFYLWQVCCSDLFGLNICALLLISDLGGRIRKSACHSRQTYRWRKNNQRLFFFFVWETFFSDVSFTTQLFVGLFLLMKIFKNYLFYWKAYPS